MGDTTGSVDDQDLVDLWVGDIDVERTVRFQRDGNGWVPYQWDPEAEQALLALSGLFGQAKVLPFLVEAARIAGRPGWDIDDIENWVGVLTGFSSRSAPSHRFSPIPEPLLPVAVPDRQVMGNIIFSGVILDRSLCQYLVDTFPDTTSRLRGLGNISVDAVDVVVADIGDDGEVASYRARLRKDIHRTRRQVAGALRTMAPDVDRETLRQVIVDPDMATPDRVNAFTHHLLDVDDRDQLLGMLSGTLPELAPTLVHRVGPTVATDAAVADWVASFPDLSVFDTRAITKLPSVLKHRFRELQTVTATFDHIANAPLTDQGRFWTNFADMIDWYGTPPDEIRTLIGSQFSHTLALYGRFRQWKPMFKTMTIKAERLGIPVEPAIPADTLPGPLRASFHKSLTNPNVEGQWIRWTLTATDLLLSDNPSPTDLEHLEQMDGWDRGLGSKHRKLLHTALHNQIRHTST